MSKIISMAFLCMLLQVSCKMEAQSPKERDIPTVKEVSSIKIITETRFKFSDEATKDSSLTRFRKELVDSTHFGGMNFLLNHLSENFSKRRLGQSRKIEFVNEIRRANRRSTDSSLKILVDYASTNGGCLWDTIFTSPFSSCIEYPDWCMVEEVGLCGVTMRQNILVFNKPDSSSEIIEKINGEFVMIKNDIGCGPCRTACKWVEIGLSNGKSGFVSPSDVGDEHRYHIEYYKEGNQWTVGEIWGPGIECSSDGDE